VGVSNSVPSGVTSATVNISKPNGTPEVYTITGPNFVQGVINAINSNNQSAFTAQIFSTSNGLIKVISKEQGTVNDGSFVSVSTSSGTISAMIRPMVGVVSKLLLLPPVSQALLY